MTQVATLPETSEPLSPSDARALAISMSLDDIQKKEAYASILLEKWSGHKDGKYDPRSDWLGDPSTAKFPALRNDNEKLAMAMLLENQHVYQKSKELKVVNGRVILTQDTTTADEALPTKYALPIVRRTYALVLRGDWSTTQPLPGPSGYVFWLDFLREADTSNLLSTEYNALITPELGVPPKGKLRLERRLVQVIKQLLGLTWTLESSEDARAQLGIDVEGELLKAFAAEFVRNLFARHLKKIMAAALGADFTFNPDGTAVGSNLPAGWLGPGTPVTIPAALSGMSAQDRKAQIFNSLIDADTQFQRVNFAPTDGIVCGYGLAGLLRKMLTATGTVEPDAQNMSSVGLTNYGTYDERWTIWGTSFVDNDKGFLYRRSPGQLEAAHIYSPYVPVQLMPAIYGDYDPVTGNYQNKDAWTRNIRERSADMVTKPYGFQAIVAASLAF